MTRPAIIDFNVTCPCGKHFGEVHFEGNTHTCSCGGHYITRQGEVLPVVLSHAAAVAIYFRC